MKILHLLSADLWAGAEVMAYHLLGGLHSNNICHAQVVVLNEGRVAESLRQQGIKVIVCDETRLSFSSLLKQVRQVLHEFQPEIIHSHRYKENILGYLASRGMGKVKLLATQHGMPEKKDNKLSLKKRCIKTLNFSLLSKCFDRLVAVSHDMKSQLVASGISSGKVPVIHNGVELPAKPQGSGSKNFFVVGSCGRLFPVKNYGLFIDTAAQVMAESSRTRFELAGDGPQMENLQFLCRQHRLNGRFDFLGHVQNMSSFYQGLDIYMSTSIHEGIPMSVLEAMGHGLPVVAPKVGGFPEIVEHGVDGFLIPEHDPVLFAQACLQLKDDPNLLASMSTAAREKIESKFSVQCMTKGYHTLYQELTS